MLIVLRGHAALEKRLGIEASRRSANDDRRPVTLISQWKRARRRYGRGE
jgi:hypothetical protein